MVFHNFSRQIAFSQYSRRSIVSFKRNRSNISKITYTASWFSFLWCELSAWSSVWITLIELRFNIIANLLLFFLLFNGFMISYNDVWSYKAFDTRDIFERHFWVLLQEMFMNGESKRHAQAIKIARETTNNQKTEI